MYRILLFLSFFLTLLACNSNETIHYLIEDIRSPSEKNCSLCRFTQNDKGQQLLSWIEENDDQVQLKFSYFNKAETWSKPSQIASGADWFVNWADFPSVNALDENRLVAHWLQMRDTGTYDYDIMISHSVDQGAHWAQPSVLHDDGIAAEHGFLSSVVEDGNIHFSWLDGRAMKNNQPMTIRYAKMNQAFEISDQRLIDSMVCECCQTDMQYFNGAPFTVYRDRTEKELRDIGYWDGIKTASIHNDNWLIGGCPVNGPAIAKTENALAVSWYTQQESIPVLKLAFYETETSQFNDPIVLTDEYVLGRIDIAWINENYLAISFLQSLDEKTYIVLKIVDDKGATLETIKVAESSAKRNSGFPSLLTMDGNIYVAYLDVINNTGIKIKKISWLKS